MSTFDGSNFDDHTSGCEKYLTLVGDVNNPRHAVTLTTKPCSNGRKAMCIKDVKIMYSTTVIKYSVPEGEVKKGFLEATIKVNILANINRLQSRLTL